MFLHFLYFHTVYFLRLGLFLLRRPKYIPWVSAWLIWKTRFKASEFEARRLRLTGRFQGDELNTLGTPVIVAHALLKAAQLPSSSILVDLGAGQGAFLMAGLLHGCPKVVGVEAHGDLVAGLKDALPEQVCELIHADLREVLLPQGEIYIATWTTWAPQTRSQLLQQLQFAPKGTKIWVWTHEIQEKDWSLRMAQVIQMPGYEIEAFLYEKD